MFESKLFKTSTFFKIISDIFIIYSTNKQCNITLQKGGLDDKKSIIIIKISKVLLKIINNACMCGKIYTLEVIDNCT